MTDYRPWPTKASFHGKKQEYRPFKARFDYNTTYKHDFDDKVRPSEHDHRCFDKRVYYFGFLPSSSLTFD